MTFKVELSDISLSYEGVRVLEKIGFSVGEGDFIGVIGPNGSGKTTLLRTIARVLRPESGAVFVNGLNINQLSRREIAQNIAVVSQETNMVFSFTAFEVVLMGRTPHASRFKIEDQDDFVIAEEVMKVTDTWHLADRPISELSGGEKQRVMIAQALAQKTRLLLLDEPTSHLDINHQLQILDLIRNRSRGGLAVVAVFHDLNLASRFADILILLKDGCVHINGLPEEVLTVDNIGEVFAVDAHIEKHPATGETYIYPLQNAKSKERV
ncbi:MAG: heme ABC transporter ATP-binding protein [Actinomycetia bacterium]|nr:heme ABC transporter ATP-binding protein [Actinomycetes bacterium]